MIHALPQTLTGQELVTIQQDQNGQIVKCSMSLESFSLWVNGGSSTAWANSLQSTLPATAGVVWNNGGMVSIS